MRTDRFHEVVRRVREHGAVLVAAALAATGIASWTAVTGSPAPVYATPRLPWWVLALCFGVAEVCVVHVQVRREARTVSLSELPLCLGLLFATPGALLVGRLVGPMLALAVHRRQSPIKLLFNAALLFCDVSAALAVFRLLHPAGAVSGPRLWAAVGAAAVTQAVVGAVAVTVVVASYEGVLRPGPVLRAVRQTTLLALSVAAVGLVAAEALADDPAVVTLLLVLVAAAFAGYRIWARLYERHAAVERLYAFSGTLGRCEDARRVLEVVLTEGRDLLHAEAARLVLVERDGEQELVATLDASGHVAVQSRVGGRADHVWKTVVDTDMPMMLGRGTRQPELRRYLDRTGRRDAIVVPLHRDGVVIGALEVADRLGEIRTFRTQDVRLLETVANHASVALDHSRLIEQLSRDALHDALTGLPNRALLQRRIDSGLEDVHAGRTGGLAVLLFDLNGFKQINDTLGHHAGDELLQYVARRVTEAAGPTVTVARLGGDEFALLVTGESPDIRARGVAEAVHQAIGRPVELGGLAVQVGASIGIALVPDHADDTPGLLRRADVAMYAAKSSNEQTVVYNPALDDNTEDRLALLSELRQAVGTEQLVVFLQPKVRIDDSSVVGAEALVRWRHPTMGLLAPDAFVPLAENNGLITRVTWHVLDAAIEAAAQFRTHGQDLGVAVNLSTRDLLDAQLVERVAAGLARYRVPAELVTLEITENSVMTNTERAITTLQQLRTLGVRLSLDDFGTGYSSLSYLRRLPVHEVKIDRSFVSNATRNDADLAIVRSVIDLAGNLGLDVVAEGVEDDTVCTALRDASCDIAQGYLFSKPLPVDEFATWLAHHEKLVRAPLRLVTPA